MNLLEKFISRKLIGFIIVSVLCFAGKVDGWIWVISFAIYVGGNALDKLLASKNGNK